MQDEPQSTAFGRLLREYRLQVGLTQEELAERAGLGRRSIQGLERGENIPHRGTLQRLVQALALSPEEASRLAGATKPSPRGRRALSKDGGLGKSLSAVWPDKQQRHNLPAPLTSFIGREQDGAEVKRLMQSARLVTLTGPGGCGKTRLAYQVASEVQESYADGVVAIELAAIADPSLIAEIIAVTLNLHDLSPQTILTRLAACLRSQHLLLLLDNCEHLLDECARIADTLLRECPHLTVLVTSREPLRIIGEAVWRVPSLPIPPLDSEPGTRGVEGYAAVQLFVERAQAVRPGFAVTPENAAAVVRICRRLDGLPHAIELAAARVNALSVDQIAARLDQRFRLLTTGSRAASPRHQTLRATIDWSHDLLSEPERALFRHLAVFAGGWTLNAAEVVCGTLLPDRRNAVSASPRRAVPTVKEAEDDVLDRLGQLVDKSLVQVDERDGVVRYRLLETIREYAWECLIEAGEEDPARARHRDWYLALAEEAERAVWGARQPEAVEMIEVERDNLWAALAWSVEHGPDAAARLVYSLFWFWAFQSRWLELARWCEAILERPLTDERARAQALMGAGFGLRDVQPDRAIRLTEESLATLRSLGDQLGCGWALNNLGIIASIQGHHGEAGVLLEESLACFRTAGHQAGIGMALRDLGEAAVLAGDYDRAERCLFESLTVLREVDDCWNLGFTLRICGEIALRQGDFGRARSLLEEAQARFGAINSVSVCFVLVGLGCLALVEEDTRRAWEHLREVLALDQRLGYNEGVAVVVYLLAAAHIRGGAVERGVRSMSAAAKHTPPSYVFNFFPAAHLLVETALEKARAALADEEFARAWAEGQGMTLEQAVAYALEGDGG